jgi:hypothetical protein
MDPEVRKRLRQTITVRSSTSYTDAGNEVLGVARSIPCYIETHVENVTGPGGTERKWMTLVITELAVDEHDRVYLPGEDATDDHAGARPDRVVAFTDPIVDNAVDHYEVWL